MLVEAAPDAFILYSTYKGYEPRKIFLRTPGAPWTLCWERLVFSLTFCLLIHLIPGAHFGFRQLGSQK